MARSIGDLAQFPGRQTIAECVDDEATAATLREIGVDYLQGWHSGELRSAGSLAEEIPRAGRPA
jgi:EAL domain-containing protein (putative c-di-GMP-specific phosphodiesterase class I)